MKRWHQKLLFVPSFGNTEVKKSLLQIALRRYWKASFSVCGIVTERMLVG
jgi:hypothetical protein